MSEMVSIEIWYGGKFKEARGSISYVGGFGKVMEVDPNALSMDYLMTLADKCDGDRGIQGLFYLLPGSTLKDGLRKIDGENVVRELHGALMQFRTVNVYVLHKYPTPKAQPKKLTPRRSTNVPLRRSPRSKGALFPNTNVDHPLEPEIHLDTRDKSVEGIASGNSSSEDEDYEVGLDDVELEEELDDVELEDELDDVELEEEIVDVEGSSDEEFVAARHKFRGEISKLVNSIERVQREAAQGTHGDQQTDSGDSSDDIETPPGSDEEENGDASKLRNRGPLIGDNTDFKSFTWQVGQRFTSRQSFKNAVAKYGILQGRNITITSSNNNRKQYVNVKCVSGCQFYLYGGWDSRRAVYVVKSVDGEHTCSRNMQKNRQMKSRWVADNFLEVFKVRPHWPAKEIMATIKKAFGVLVNKDFAYRVKYHAHRMLHGSMLEHYTKLGSYIEAMKHTNPQSLVKLVTDPTRVDDANVFQRLHVCFEGLKHGWLEGCRKVICIDACFLKTFLGGQLLSAIGRDHNDQMYPISWAVVEGENNESWEWFLQNLQSFLNLGDGTDLVIISDEHQAILNGVAKVLPKAEHRHCARHIYAHWHKSFKGEELKLLFWKAVKAYNMADFDDALVEMEKILPAAVDGFKSYNPACFCRAYMSSTTKVDVIVNNMAETFNGYIITARTKHIMHMLEDIRTQVMERLYVKKGDVVKWKGDYGPRVIARLEKEKEKAKNCDAIPSTDTIFQCSHYLGDVMTVNLESRTCTCRKWDLTGIPCRHAISCISYVRKTPEDFIDPLYKKDNYLRAYAYSIPPMEGPRFWPRTDLTLTPPPIKIGPGRPRLNRRKDPHESPKKLERLSRHGMEMTCGICKVKGHNKRKCPNKDRMPTNDEPPQPPRKRGRPSKASTSTTTISENVQERGAQPTRIGRNGRSIHSGVGSRGGRTGQARGRGGRTSTSEVAGTSSITQASTQPTQASTQPTQASVS